MSISLLEVFWNYLAFDGQPGGYKTGLLTNSDCGE
jgi:hypothetical protein